MKTLAQIAYEAHKEPRYRAPWEDLPEHEKEQWRRAAQAVADKIAEWDAERAMFEESKNA